ncbi:MAG: polyprenyl synthetase family protein [Armatimonadetes bacterium]|nr:polyprenyl synthetase family protein [Armatimonadota bacterium]
MTAPAMVGLLSKVAPPWAVSGLAERLEAVEACLRQESASVVKTVAAVGETTLEAGGKRLRPALAVVSACAAGGSDQDTRIIGIGACLELVHMATLVHDDVIDESPTRRGRPTAASVVGNTAAILSGDVLLAKAMRLLAADGDTEIIRSVSEAVVDLAEGEVMELELRGLLSASEDAYRTVVARKTSALLSCACRVGAMTAGADPTVTVALSEYGRRLGDAFQIADDLLDYDGDRLKTGKPWATDFREGQPTLPLIFLTGALSAEESVFVETRFGNGVGDDDLTQICGWMKDRGALAKAADAARHESDQAIAALSALPDSPYKDILEGVARFVVERDA